MPPAAEAGYGYAVAHRRTIVVNEDAAKASMPPWRPHRLAMVSEKSFVFVRR